MADRLKCGTEFSSEIFACCCLDFGKEDKGEFGLIDGDAIRLHGSHLRLQKFHVGPTFFWKLKVKAMMSRNCSRMSVVLGWSAPCITALRRSSSWQSWTPLKSDPSAVLRTVLVISDPTLLVMASAAPSFAPITA